MSHSEHEHEKHSDQRTVGYATIKAASRQFSKLEMFLLAIITIALGIVVGMHIGDYIAEKHFSPVDKLNITDICDTVYGKMDQLEKDVNKMTEEARKVNVAIDVRGQVPVVVEGKVDVCNSTVAISPANVPQPTPTNVCPTPSKCQPKQYPTIERVKPKPNCCCR